MLRAPIRFSAVKFLALAVLAVWYFGASIPVAAQNQTYEHTSFEQEDANDDWNNDGTPDGTDRFGGTPNDGLLRWPAGTHTLHWSTYSVPEGGRLIIHRSKLQETSISLAEDAKLEVTNSEWIGGSVFAHGAGSSIEMSGCVGTESFSVSAGHWNMDLRRNEPAGTLELRECVFDTTGLMGDLSYTSNLAGVWERVFITHSSLWATGSLLSSASSIEIEHSTIYIHNQSDGWENYFSEMKSLQFGRDYGYRSLRITNTRFQGTNWGIAVTFTIPDSSFETTVRNCSFINAPIAIHASNTALQHSDFTWNFWGNGDGPYFWYSVNYTYEERREWADHGFNFIAVYTWPDRFFPVPFEPYITIDHTDSTADFDRDGLLTPAEELIGTDPYNPDTDGDGIPDGVEVSWSTDPLDPDDPGVPEEEVTEADSLALAEMAEQGLDALGDQAPDSLRQSLSGADVAARQQVVAAAYHEYTANGILAQVQDLFSNNLELMGLLTLNEWPDVDSLVNRVLDKYFTSNYDTSAARLLSTRTIPPQAPPPDTLNRLVRERTGLPLGAQMLLSDQELDASKYETPDGSKKAFFLHRDDLSQKPTLIGESEKGAINALEGVGKLMEKVDGTGFLTKIYNANLISGVLKAGVRNANRYVTHDGANIFPKQENLVYVKDPPPARIPIAPTDRVLTIRGVGQVSLVYEADGRKFIKVDGRAFRKDNLNWSWWRRSWTSKIVGGIPYQLLPLKPVDESKGIYEVDTSAIPDVVKNQPPLWGVLTSADGDTLEPLFATVDADSDSVAEVLELDADHDGRFDTFLFAVGGDSCGYNLAKVDTNADGEVDLIFSDLTGDGFFDAVDLNLDGRNDAFDTNGDGVFDRVDYDCDGTFDAYDVNLNGRLDLFLIPAGGFTKVQETRAQNLPRRFTMTQNYPNPVSWSQATTLRYGLPKGAHVRIELYNVLGQKVATVIDRHEAPGWHEIAWSPRSALRPLPSGVYFLRFTADAGRTFQAVRKMVIRR